MKRGIWLLLLAAALGVCGTVPFRSVDVAQLLPVQVLTVDVRHGQVQLDGGVAKGSGADLDAALADLRARAEGHVFLATAEQVVLSESAAYLLPQVVHWQVLRPAAGVTVAAPELPAAEDAAKFLRAHDPGVTLQQVRAALLRRETISVPQLYTWEGGMRLYGTKADR